MSHLRSKKRATFHGKLHSYSKSFDKSIPYEEDIKVVKKKVSKGSVVKDMMVDL